MCISAPGAERQTACGSPGYESRTVSNERFLQVTCEEEPSDKPRADLQALAQRFPKFVGASPCVCRLNAGDAF